VVFGCFYVTVDSATATSENSVGITQQKCHKMIMFQTCFMLKKYNNLILNYFFEIFWKNIRFIKSGMGKQY